MRNILNIFACFFINKVHVFEQKEALEENLPTYSTLFHKNHPTTGDSSGTGVHEVFAFEDGENERC